MKLFKSNNCREKGAVAVEFALILPVLVLLLFGIIEFGRAYNAYVTVTHAAREGARLAAVGDFDTQVVEERAYPLDVTVEGPTYPNGNVHGEPVEVSVSYPYQLQIPLWGSLNFDLSSTGVMRIE